MTAGIFVLGGTRPDFARNYSARVSRSATSWPRSSAAPRDATVEPAAIALPRGQRVRASCSTARDTSAPCRRPSSPGLWGAGLATRSRLRLGEGGDPRRHGPRSRPVATGCALVLGVEQERNVPGDQAARTLGAAAWVGPERRTRSTRGRPCSSRGRYDDHVTASTTSTSGRSPGSSFRNAKDNHARRRARGCTRLRASRGRQANRSSGRIRRTGLQPGHRRRRWDRARQSARRRGLGGGAGDPLSRRCRGSSAGAPHGRAATGGEVPPVPGVTSTCCRTCAAPITDAFARAGVGAWSASTASDPRLLHTLGTPPSTTSASPRRASELAGRRDGNAERDGATPSTRPAA